MTQDINEVRFKEFQSVVHPQIEINSRLVTVKFDTLYSTGLTVFLARAVTTPGRDWWRVYIKMLDWNRALKMTDLPLVKRVNLAVFGDLAVGCNCTAFLMWGQRYWNTQMDTVIGPREDRKPVVNLKYEDCPLCKHIYAAMKALPFSITDFAKIAKDSGWAS